VSRALQRHEVAGRLLDGERATHEIPYFESLEEPRLRNFERHCHTRHQSADVVVLDGDFLTRAIDGENLTVQVIALRPRTAAQQGRGSDQERKNSTHDCTLP